MPGPRGESRAAPTGSGCSRRASGTAGARCSRRTSRRRRRRRGRRRASGRSGGEQHVVGRHYESVPHRLVEDGAEEALRDLHRLLQRELLFDVVGARGAARPCGRSLLSSKLGSAKRTEKVRMPCRCPRGRHRRHNRGIDAAGEKHAERDGRRRGVFAPASSRSCSSSTAASSSDRRLRIRSTPQLPITRDLRRGRSPASREELRGGRQFAHALQNRARRHHVLEREILRPPPRGIELARHPRSCSSSALISEAKTSGGRPASSRAASCRAGPARAAAAARVPDREREHPPQSRSTHASPSASTRGESPPCRSASGSDGPAPRARRAPRGSCRSRR